MRASPARIGVPPWPGTWWACALFLASLVGCTIAPVPEPPLGTLPPSDFSRRELESYWALSTVVFDDGDRRWIVSPSRVLEFSNGFFSVEYAADEGLAGHVLSAAQDDSRLWLGTSSAIQTLEKDLHLFRTHIVEENLQTRFVTGFDRDSGLALTARGAVLIDAAALTYVFYPIDAFDIREVTDALYEENDLWVATLRGLWRFSTVWKTWNQSFGSKTLERAAVLRLERVADRRGDTIVGESLYAITPNEVFVYRSAFDNWERLGF